jgi:hypothetical protein
MKQKEFERWKKYRKIGQLKFTLLWLLYWIVVLNIAALGANAIEGNFNFNIEGFFTRLIMGSLVGVFTGPMKWKTNERAYNNYIENRNNI